MKATFLKNLDNWDYSHEMYREARISLLADYLKIVMELSLS